MPTKLAIQTHYYETWDRYISERNKIFIGGEHEHEAEKLMWMLFYRINELSDDVIFLAKKSRFSSCFIILRSAMETLIDLRCLVEDDTFIEVMKKSERDQEIKHLNKFTENNKYYGSKSKEDVNRAMEQLKDLTVGTRQKNIYEKFETAEAVDAYGTVYNHLSRHTHGNITTLCSRHLENGCLKLNRSVEVNELRFILSCAINFAISSAIEISSKLELEDGSLELFNKLLIESNTLEENFNNDR